MFGPALLTVFGAIWFAAANAVGGLMLWLTIGFRLLVAAPRLRSG